MKQIIYLGGNKAMEYDGIDQPDMEDDKYFKDGMGIINIAKFNDDAKAYIAHISTLPVFDVIGDCDWKKGDVKTEGVDYVLHDWWDVIVPIPKKQEGESAATPPDVEQMAEEVLLKYIPNGCINLKGGYAGEKSAIKAALVEMYQAGQSAVQDATPQEEVWVENKITDSGFAVCKYNDDEGRWQPYYDVEKVNLSTLRSELSAAQEEIIRLNSKINYQDAVIQQRNAMLTARGQTK